MEQSDDDNLPPLWSVIPLTVSGLEFYCYSIMQHCYWFCSLAVDNACQFSEETGSTLGGPYSDLHTPFHHLHMFKSVTAFQAQNTRKWSDAIWSVTTLYFIMTSGSLNWGRQNCKTCNNKTTLRLDFICSLLFLF